MWFRKVPARREVVIEDQTRPLILALIRTFYPLLLQERILRCVSLQRRGYYTRCCRSLYCPCCSSRESHTRATTQYNTFRAATPQGAKTRLAHEVYTLPPYLHAHVATREGFNAWREAVRLTVRELYAAPVSGVMNLHPMGDRDITKWHAHWDVVVNGYHLDENGAVVKTDPRLFDYDHGREVYVKHLCRAFKLTGASVPREVDVWWERKKGHVFSEGRNKTWHMVKYSARNVYRPERAWLKREPDSDVLPEHAWAYKPKDNEPPTYFHGPSVMNNLQAQQAWLKGKIRHAWFGYLKDKHRAAAIAQIRGTPPPPHGESSP